MKALTISGMLCAMVGICALVTVRTVLLNPMMHDLLLFLGSLLIGGAAGILALRRICRMNPIILDEIDKLDKHRKGVT